MSHPSQQTCLVPWALKLTAVHTHSCALLAPALPLVARAAHAMPIPGGIGATLAAAAVGAQQRRCRLATRRHEGPRFSRTQKVRNGGSWAVDPLLPGVPPWPLSLLRTRGNCSCGAPLCVQAERLQVHWAVLAPRAQAAARDLRWTCEGKGGTAMRSWKRKLSCSLLELLSLPPALGPAQSAPSQQLTVYRSPKYAATGTMATATSSATIRATAPSSFTMN